MLWLTCGSYVLHHRHRPGFLPRNCTLRKGLFFAAFSASFSTTSSSRPIPMSEDGVYRTARIGSGRVDPRRRVDPRSRTATPNSWKLSCGGESKAATAAISIIKIIHILFTGTSRMFKSSFQKILLSKTVRKLVWNQSWNVSTISFYIICCQRLKEQRKSSRKTTLHCS